MTKGHRLRWPFAFGVIGGLGSLQLPRQFAISRKSYCGSYCIGAALPPSTT